MSSPIEWTDETWNPTVGCSRVSPGCDNCYAIGVAHRAMQDAHRGLTLTSPATRGSRGGHGRNGRPDWTGEVRQLPDRLETPFHWRRPRRVFVDSMSDLFLAEDEFMARVWAVMSLTPQHTYQVLTKRHRSLGTLDDDDGEFIYKVQLARRMFQAKLLLPDSDLVWPVPNVWLGVSAENQRYADLRVPHLLCAPASIRFLSIEPLLGPIDLMGAVEPDWIGSSAGGSGAPHPLIDWVIVGGESGPGARPMHPQWVRDLRDQCVAARVPFFFKQWGEWADPHAAGRLSVPGHRTPQACWVLPDGSTRAAPSTCPAAGSVPAWRFGKKITGRVLDGRTWDEMPEAARA